VKPYILVLLATASAAMVAATMAAAQPRAAQPRTEAAKKRYAACIALVKSDPHKALSRASAWGQRNGGLPADHCLALALVALKQYADAAKELERIATAMAQPPNPLRPEVLDQEGNAWLLADNAKQAYGSFSAAVALAPEDADYLTDRARAAIALGDYGDAARDLTMALRYDPTRINLYILRAEARRKLGQIQLAVEDADTALALNPDSVRALVERGILREDLGDAKGAEQDWLSVVRLAPDTAAAAEAQAHIQTLALKPKAKN
jgi:tetratricopeptide (TPR) repeat protein